MIGELKLGNWTRIAGAAAFAAALLVKVAGFVLPV